MTLIRHVGLVILATFFQFLPAFSQEEVQVVGDLEDPIDTLDLLVAKGGAADILTEKQLKERLATLSSCVDLRINGVVKGYIRTYVEHKTEKAKIMLGKRLTYFPLYEEKFKEAKKVDLYQFIIYLYIQQFYSIDLKSSVMSREEWPVNRNDGSNDRRKSKVKRIYKKYIIFAFPNLGTFIKTLIR